MRKLKMLPLLSVCLMKIPEGGNNSDRGPPMCDDALLASSF